MDKCKLDLTRWSSLPLSLSGRVNLVKMVILPKFLYLFQHIPIFYWTAPSFSNWTGRFRRFCGGISRPVLEKLFLQLPKKSGRSSRYPTLSNTIGACNINKIGHWLDRGADAGPSWVLTELRSSKFSLPSLLTARLPLKIHNVSQNPVVTNSLKIWNQFRKHYGLNEPSTLAPVVKNHLFPPSSSDPTFTIWRNKGLLYVKDLYKENIFTDFTELAARFELPHSHLFSFPSSQALCPNCVSTLPQPPRPGPWVIPCSPSTLLKSAPSLWFTIPLTPSTPTKQLVWSRPGSRR